MTRPKRPARPAKAGDTRTLLPVMRPNFNLREICKEAVLLADHWENNAKRCRDCCTKHALKIEALAEETKSLCAGADPQAHADAAQVARTIRVLHHAYAQDPGNPALVQRVAGLLRQMRKKLQARYGTLDVDTLPSEETAAVRALVRASKPLKSRQRRPPARRR